MCAIKKVFFLLIALNFVDVAYLTAQEALYPDFSQLQGLFWINRGYENTYDPSTQNMAERSNEEYVGDLLELCRQWFSGIIYGYHFYYQPLDRTRQIDEVFTLVPIHQIPWGDRGLEYLGAFEEGDRIEMDFRYFTKAHEVSRLRGWRSSQFVNSSGRAATPDRNTLQSRLDSFQEAVKQAIRSHFRSTTFNKPQEISGSIALFTMPRSYSDAGLIHTSLKVTIDLDKLVSYQQF